VLEVQQSSDMTYRLFDYERTDDHGNLRELHLDKAFAVIKAPYHAKTAPNESRKIGPNAHFTSIANNQYFQTAKVEVTGDLELTLSAAYLLVSVIDGFANMNGVAIKKGDHFIVPNTLRKLSIVGYVTLIVANETPAS
jgi:mannose-6-phosphate isomerase